MKLRHYIAFGTMFFPVLLMAQGIVISSGATMKQAGGTITLLRDWTNNGTFTPTGGTVTFAGTAAQSLSGSSLQSFNNLTVASGSVVSVQAQVNVTVNSTLTNSNGNAGLVLKSTAAGSGSLIHSTAGVAATVERYMNQNRWHVIGTSVAGQSIPSFLTDGANTIPTSGSNYGMMYYSESSGWVYYTNPAAGTFSVGNGYLARHTTDAAVSLAGTLNAATVSVNVTKTGNGWNGVGNPFPCSIGVRTDASTANNFLDYNAAKFDPSFAALYLWDEPAVRTSGVSYYKIICNAGFTSTTGRPIIDQAYMQPGQGFIIKVNAAGTVDFTSSMRLHETTGSYFKSSKASWPGMNIIVNSATKSTSTSVTFHQNMTRGLDITYDAGLLGGDPNFRLYSRLVNDNGINFMLQCLPDNDTSLMRIPLGCDYKDGGTITFTADLVMLPTGLVAVLVDSLLGIHTDLKGSSGTYTTTVDPNTSGIGRFYLNITNPAIPKPLPDTVPPIVVDTTIIAVTPDTVTVTTPKDTVSTLVGAIDHSIDIYAYGHNIIVKARITKSTRANLYDISGRIVRAYILNSADINILPADDIPTGIYILKVSGNGFNENKKIFLE